MSKALEAFEKIWRDFPYKQYSKERYLRTVIIKALKRSEPMLEKLKTIEMLVDKKRFNTDDIELLRSSIIEVLERDDDE